MRPLRTVGFALVAALTIAACSFSGTSGSSSGGSSSNLGGSNIAGENDGKAPTLEVPTYGKKLSGTLTIGLVISSIGAGKDYQNMANGARVVPSLVGDDKVEVVTEDDQGTPEGAQAAVRSLIDQGAVAIVYGSAGPQLDAGIKAAAGADVPVVLPYAGDPAVELVNDNAYTVGLPDPEVADKMAAFAKETRNYTRPVLISMAGDPYGTVGTTYLRSSLTELGAPPVLEIQLKPEEVADPRAFRELLLPIKDVAADAVFVWGDAAQTYQVINQYQRTGYSAQVFIAPRAAVPALGGFDAGGISKAVRNGTLSVGFVGGPWLLQDPSIRNYYSKRQQAARETSADFTVADPISASAGLAIVAAAEKGGADSASIDSALQSLSFEGIGAEFAFSDQVGVDLDDYCLTAYSNEEGASATYVAEQFPGVDTAGGFFVAVPGTAPTLDDVNYFGG